MPSTFTRSTAAVTAEADAVGALLDGGYLRIYTGEQPKTADTAADASNLLAELRFRRPAGTVADGVFTAQQLQDELSAAQDGEPTWFRAVMADGVTAVYDGSVGLSSDQPDLAEPDVEVG